MAPKNKFSQTKVLIADDDKAIQDLLALFLSNKGFRTFTASSGEEALERFQAEKPDLVLLDINMLGLDGVEVLRRIKAQAPECKVIMLTALRDEAVFKRCLEMGAAYYLAKPIELKYLDALIVGKLL